MIELIRDITKPILANYYIPVAEVLKCGRWLGLVRTFGYVIYLKSSGIYIIIEMWIESGKGKLFGEQFVLKLVFDAVAMLFDRHNFVSKKFV